MSMLSPTRAPAKLRTIAAPISPSVSTCTRAVVSGDAIAAGRHLRNLPVAPPAGIVGQCQLALQQGRQRRAGQLEADVGMQAAGIVRIGGRDDPGNSALAIVADDHLAMVGLEIEQPCPRTEAHLVGPGVERIRKAGLPGPIARPPAHGQPPEGGVDRVRIAQGVEVGRHHLDARVAQRRQIARRQAAIDVVDGVGDHQDIQLRHRALARQQCVAQLGGQFAMRLGVDRGAALAVEQEEIEHQVFARVADQREHGIEDLLAHHRRAEHVGTGHIREKPQLVQRRVDDFAAHADAFGQWLVEIPERGQQPEREKTIEKQPSQAPLARRHRWWGRRVDRCLVRLFSHSAILAARRAPASVSPTARLHE